MKRPRARMVTWRHTAYAELIEAVFCATLATKLASSDRFLFWVLLACAALSALNFLASAVLAWGPE